MKYTINVGFTTHRVEILKLLEKELEKSKAIILEEPKNTKLYDYFEGKKGLSEYIEELNTTLPVFTIHFLKLLKKMHGKGIKILQIEPYLENLEKIYRAIDKGEFENAAMGEDIETVREVERKATEMLIKYQEAFLRQDFDGVIDATINFTKADAERFRVRDYMRAREIKEIMEKDELPSNIFVEAGQMHFLLPEHLSRMLQNSEITVIKIVEKMAEYCNLKLISNPGNQLTSEYIMGKKIDRDYERLMAARGIIYISLIKKEEMVPSNNNPCPHLMDEMRVADYVSKLSYEDCRKKFIKLWGSIKQK